MWSYHSHHYTISGVLSHSVLLLLSHMFEVYASPWDSENCTDRCNSFPSLQQAQDYFTYLKSNPCLMGGFSFDLTLTDTTSDIEVMSASIEAWLYSPLTGGLLHCVRLFVLPCTTPFSPATTPVSLTATVGATPTLVVPFTSLTRWTTPTPPGTGGTTTTATTLTQKTSGLSVVVALTRTPRCLTRTSLPLLLPRTTSTVPLTLNHLLGGLADGFTVLVLLAVAGAGRPSPP